MQVSNCYNYLKYHLYLLYYDSVFRDFAQLRLMQEVQDIKEVVDALHTKLQEAEAQHQALLKTRSTLEADLRNKVNALFIDREKCMGLRRSFPVDNLIKY